MLPRMTARTPLIAGNWKMNGSADEASLWAHRAAGAAATSKNDVAVFPPAVHLDRVQEIVTESRVSLGAQCCHPEPSGAYTGAISASMLPVYGVSMVLCGHSERRHLFGESDEFVAQSMKAALGAGLTAVLCVGETLEEREAGMTREVLLRQIDAALELLPTQQRQLLVVAYEPVWAIGTGKAASPVEAGEAHAWIRARIAQVDGEWAGRLRILYGGSVKPANIEGFLAVPDIDGALVGGAALKPDDFAALIAAGR